MKKFLAIGWLTKSLSSLLVLANMSSADNWPQIRGIHRDGVWHETGIVRSFPEGGLPAKWRVPVNLGYSGPAVVDGRVFLTDYVKETGSFFNDGIVTSDMQGKERILCLNAETGEKLWEHSYPSAYKIGYGSGPRATPTVHAGKVYAMGAEGNLTCLDVQSGQVVWSKELKTEYKAKTPHWGFCGSPLVDGNKLICVVGGKGSVLVAFDKDTGAELWKSLSSNTGYSSPSIVEAGNVRQLIMWHSNSINGLNPESGEVYWSVPLKAQYTTAIMIPQKHGDYLYACCEAGTAALLKLDSEKPSAEVIWRGEHDTAIYAGTTNPIIDDTGTLYATDNMSGHLKAMELKTGKRLWETLAPYAGNRRVRHGTVHIVRNGDRYLIFSETGDLILARLSAKEYEEISRFHLIDPTGFYADRDVAWSHPAFANKCVYARNDKELVCVSLARQEN